MNAKRAMRCLVAGLLLAGCAASPRGKETIDLVTPLPANFEVLFPPTGLPKQIADFSGIWKGDWLLSEQGSGPTGILHHTLVVKDIQPSSSGGYRASVIYSAGAPPTAWEGGGPGFWELPGNIGADGVLRLTAPGPGGGQVIYTMSEDRQSLSGHYILPGKSIEGTFHRVR